MNRDNKWIELKIGYQSNNVACFLQNHYATNRFETFKLLVALFKYWINGKNWR